MIQQSDEPATGVVNRPGNWGGCFV